MQHAVEDLRVAAAADLAALPPSGRERKRAEAELGRRRMLWPRSRRPARPPGRRGSRTRSASGSSSTRSAARRPGCGGSWRSGAVVHARATWWRVPVRSRGGGAVDIVAALDALLSVPSGHLVVDG